MEEKSDTAKRPHQQLHHDTLTRAELYRARGWDD